MTSQAREPNRNEMLDHNKDSRCSDFLSVKLRLFYFKHIVIKNLKYMSDCIKI